MKKINIVFSIKMLMLIVLIAFGLSWNTANTMEIESISYRKLFPSLAPMLERVLPTVISVHTDGHSSAPKFNIPKQLKPFFGKNSPFCQKDSPFNSLPFCNLEFDENGKLDKKFHVLGSGVIIDADKGYAVTNNHVIENADTINVKLNDGRQYDAKIIGKDTHLDLALIQLQNATNLHAIKISDSNDLRVGDYAMAIGNPYGLGQTVTSGIISALGRSGLNIEHYENFIQTDAAINRGNSGGALINLKGELIGINTAILAPNGGNVGIGFAIPGNIVKNVTNQLIKFGKIQRGCLGVLGVELDFNLSKIMHTPIHKGTFVSRVLPNSSAYRSGIKPGDIILSLNGKFVTSFSVLQAEIASLPIKTKIHLVVFRKNKIIRFILELKEIEKHKVKKENVYLGLDGIKLKDCIVNKKSYIKVDQVKRDTIAFNFGFRKNDVILTVNQIQVSKVNEFMGILNKKPKMLVFSIKRGHEIIYLMNKS